jgi:hypothetical protein
MPKSKSSHYRPTAAPSLIEEVKVVVVGKLNKRYIYIFVFLNSTYFPTGDGYTGKVRKEINLISKSEEFFF